MGKHLTIEEKHNAPTELKENKAKIKELTQQINVLRTRNKKLRMYLDRTKQSEYKGLFAENSMVFKMFGCKYNEMTVEQKREYNRLKVAEYRKSLKK